MIVKKLRFPIAGTSLREFRRVVARAVWPVREAMFGSERSRGVALCMTVGALNAIERT